VSGAATAALLAAGTLLVRRPPSKSVLVGVLAVCLVVAALAGARGQRRYLRGRYSDRGTPTQRVFAWAQDVRGARIGYVGFFEHYPLYGRDLSNHVQYVGRRRADHSFVDLTSCPAWRRAVNQGRYQYLVVLPAFGDQPEPPAAAWTRGTAAQVLRDGRATVFQVTGPMDPAACPGPAVPSAGSMGGAPA
jgi:hypothetical protein